jgi:hypothetical protein
MKHTLNIEIDAEAKTIQVKHEEDGIINSVFLESLALFGGNAKNKEFFMKLFGASADMAWAYGQGFRIAHSPEGGPALVNFYKQCAAHICHAVDPLSFQNEIGAAEAMNMWEDPDQSRWFGQDTEDVLIDKEKSEAKRRAEARTAAPDEAPTDLKKWH